MFFRSKRTSQKISSITIKNQKIPFVLKRSSARRTLAMSINEKAEIYISAPFLLKEKDIHIFMNQKADWILTRLKEAQKRKDYIDQKQFIDGEEFLFLGKKHKLFIVEKDIKISKIAFDGLKWDVRIPLNLTQEEKKDQIRKKFIDWYRLQAKEILGGRLFHYGRILGVQPKKIIIKTQKRMWGCCDFHQQSIYLNWQIILSPESVLDYVVVHELCHLLHPNHSKQFWNEVAQIFPDYKKQKKWLKDNAMDMVLP